MWAAYMAWSRDDPGSRARDQPKAETHRARDPPRPRPTAPETSQDRDQPRPRPAKRATRQASSDDRPLSDRDHAPPVASYERAVDRAALRARRAALRMGDEARAARLTAGLSLSTVGHAAGVSPAQVSRLERGLVRRVDLVVFARVLACVGLDLGLNAFAAGSPLRDRAHLALTSRFLARISPVWRRALEARVAGPDDPRRWDLRLDGPTSIGVEFETRLYDVQAQVRRARSKQDASEVTRLLLVVADTRHNRAVLREVRSLLADDFPLDTRAVMRALAAGRDPGANGIVVL